MENESDVGTQDQDVDIDDSDDESESDEDLVAAIDRDLEEMEEEDNDDKSEDDDEDEDEDESEEDEDEEDGAQTGEIGEFPFILNLEYLYSLTDYCVEQKRQEIAEIKQAIQRKTRDLSTAPNAMLKVRWTRLFFPLILLL